MTDPSPQEIRYVARNCGYKERRSEASSTLFFEKQGILINVFYTTRGVMTKLNHPTRGQNELWRANAYDCLETLTAIFRNPRVHTGQGYRQAQQALRGCIRCGLQKVKTNFSKNQWRKGPDGSSCKACIEQSSNAVEQVGTESSNSNEPKIDGTGNSNSNEPKIDRACIQCDADGCESVAPAILCQSCRMVYYCSPACQRRHHRAHSSDCHDIEEMRRQNANYQEPDRNVMHGAAMAAQLAGKRDMESQLRQAEYIYQDRGQWESAAETYKGLLMSEEMYFASSPPQQRRVWMGLCRCFYEMGDYEKAVAAGSAALEMNRHFPQAHKYVALAQKASGDLEAAKATMTRAVLYEAPWDEANLEANKKLLKETFG